MSLGGDVTRLESEAQELADLCGEILATIMVNRERDALYCDDDKALDRLIESWTNRRDGCLARMRGEGE